MFDSIFFFNINFPGRFWITDPPLGAIVRLDVNLPAFSQYTKTMGVVVGN